MNNRFNGNQFIHAIIAHYKGCHVGNTYDSRRDYHAAVRLFEAKVATYDETYFAHSLKRKEDVPELLKKQLDLLAITMNKTGTLAGPAGRPNDEELLRYVFQMNVYWLEQKGFLVADENNGMQFISLFDNLIPNVDVMVNSNVVLIEPEGSQFEDNE